MKGKQACGHPSCPSFLPVVNAVWAQPEGLRSGSGQCVPPSPVPMPIPL